MSDMDVVGSNEDEEYIQTSSVNTQTYVKQVADTNGNGHVGRILEVSQRRMVDITRDKPIKVTIRVVVPVRDHPKFNFVGKLLGPKGNSLKRLQEDTMTKMAILGRGSMRDRHKEEELRNSGDPKFSHLLDELHVEVTAFAPPAEAHARIAYALAEVRRFLVPDYNDEIRQEQLWEMQIINSGKTETSSDTSEGVAASPESSQESLSAEEPPAVSPELRPGNSTMVSEDNIPLSHVAAGAVTTTGARKRPLLQGGGTRISMSPTKRTVLSILARARAAQAKEILSTPYQPITHITNGRTIATIPGVREESILTGASLILN